MSRRTLHDHTTAALLNITTVATLITQAAHHLEQDKGDGFSTHTIGAAIAGVGPLQDCRTCIKLEIVQMRPCPIHDKDELGPDTPVERLAFTTDQAAIDLARLTTLIRKLDLAAAEAANICTRWGLPGLTTTDIKERLADIDTMLWCAHCSTYGNHEPRSPGERHCRVCADYKRNYGDLPSKRIWQARDSRGGKLYIQDITRIRGEEALERKTRKKSA